MAVDPNNSVVRLCTEGMKAEGEGRLSDAKALFTQAWEESADNYDACIAAHYLARHQETEEDKLRWNEISLQRAESTDFERLREFFPSLLLNLGHSHEMLGRPAEARAYFERAQSMLDVIPAGPYGDLLRDGVARALQRTS
jgi:tetratricopeptide (TPR) repeat protein